MIRLLEETWLHEAARGEESLKASAALKSANTLLTDRRPLASVPDPPVVVSGVSQLWDQPPRVHGRHINHRRSLLAGCYSLYYPSHSGLISSSCHPSDTSRRCCRELGHVTKQTHTLAVMLRLQGRGGGCRSITIHPLLMVKALQRWWTHVWMRTRRRAETVISTRSRGTIMKTDLWGAEPRKRPTQANLFI